MTYTRTAADPTKYLYNAGAELNDLTGYYETFYRNYDATIGRFTGVDIMAAKYSSMTPYQYAFNDPVFWNDPLGDDPENGCGCPQPSWDHRMDWGGAMYMGEFSITGLFSGGTPWGINSGSLFNGGLIQRGQWDLANSAAMMMNDADRAQFARGYVETPESAAQFLTENLDYIVLFMADMLPNGMGLDVKGQRFHVYENPDMIEAVLSYYLNSLPKLQEFYKNQTSWNSQSINPVDLGNNWLDENVKYSLEDAERMLVEEKGYDYDLYVDLKGFNGFNLPKGGGKQFDDLIEWADFINDYAKNSKAYNSFANRYLLIMYSDQPMLSKVAELQSLAQEYRPPNITQNEIHTKFYKLNPSINHLLDE